MTPERKNETEDARLYKELAEIGNRVRYIQRRVGEMSEHFEDQYSMIEDLWEAVVLPDYIRARDAGYNGTSERP